MLVFRKILRTYLMDDPLGLDVSCKSLDYMQQERQSLYTFHSKIIFTNLENLTKTNILMT